MNNNPLLNLLLFDDDDNIHNHRSRRIFKDRINFPSIENPPSTFKEDFRLDAEVVSEILSVIGPYLQHNSIRNCALSSQQQLLLALHWFGHGSQYHLNANAHGVRKSTVYRCIHRVAELINQHLFHIHVRWPADVTNVVNKFEEIAGFPHVIGLIDGSLIFIDAPSNDEPAYVDRKNRHSINLTVVAGPNYEFFYASCKCPGSVHDARALRVSSLWQQWEIQGKF